MNANVIYPEAFAGKPVVVNPKGQGARRGRLRLCPDLSARRREKLEWERRKREQEESERERLEEEAQRLANAPDSVELVAMFGELRPWLDRSRNARAHFAYMFRHYKETFVDERGPSQQPPAA